MKWPYLVTGVFGLAALSASVSALHVIQDALAQPSVHGWALTAHAGLKAAALALFALLTVGRSAPLRKARSVVAYVSCILALGGFAMLGEPSASAGTSMVLLGDAITVVFGVWFVLAISKLGRCFGVLPEARGLVRTGTYAVVRHPVYLGEIGVGIGLTVSAPTVRNLAAAATFLAGQGVRMRLEEQALTAEFPAYAEYAATTPRIVPFASAPRREGLLAAMAAALGSAWPSRKPSATTDGS